MTIAYTGSSSEIKGEKVKLSTLAVDLDLDSDNNAGTEADGTPRPPSRNPLEEQVEDLIGHPGKVISPNLRDVDGNKVPGFADGIGLPDTGSANASAPFTPVILALSGSALNSAQATLRFDYAGSDPALVQTTTVAEKAHYTPAPGMLRLWIKDGKASRNPAGVEAGGDYVTPGTNYPLSQLGVSLSDGSRQLYLEGINPGAERIALIIDPDGDGPLPGIEGDAVRSSVVLAALVPDYNHDKAINAADQERAAMGDTYYFWINDDDDSGETGGDDIPLPLAQMNNNGSRRDADNKQVDGVRDLIDFFPVALDIKPLVELFPPNVYTYRLKSADENLKVVFPELTTETVKNYLIHVPTAQRLGTFASRTIRDNGIAPVTIEESSTQNQNKLFNAIISAAATQEAAPVLLLEGVKPGTSPLVLEITDQAGNQVFTTCLNLSLDGVEQMFRHVNLIQEINNPNAPAQESGEIGEHSAKGGERDRISLDAFFAKEHFVGFDSENVDKYLVMLHGVNNDGQVVRGWHSELFKRLYWSGSRVRFIGVSWFGSEGSSANYQQNVVNAFRTASILGPRMRAVTGNAPVVILAHSLGNIVASSYLADYYPTTPEPQRPKIGKYFLFNAAVALEAYLGDYQQYAEGKLNESFGYLDTENPMVHPAWHGYQKRFAASEWHQLFSEGDSRSTLTWRNRFANIPEEITLLSFFSSGENVLGTHIGDPGLVEAIDNGLFHDGRQAWAFQEKWKGRAPFEGAGGTTTMGWGFNYADAEYNPISSRPEDASTAAPTHLDAIAANSTIGNAVLKGKPFFNKKIPEGVSTILLDESANVDLSIDFGRERLLAKAIPSLTLPTGGKQGADMNHGDFIIKEQLFDMNAENNRNGWPVSRGLDKDWKHSDIRNIGFIFSKEIFELIVENGGPH